MAVAALFPRAKRSAWRATFRQICRNFLQPARPVLANLAKVPLFVAGLGLADFGVFHWSHALGWIVTGASLIVVERVIADET